MVSVAIAKGDVRAINYFIAQEYVKALDKIGSAPNQKVLFLPMELSGLAGVVGGVTELIRESLADSKNKEGDA